MIITITTAALFLLLTAVITLRTIRFSSRAEALEHLPKQREQFPLAVTHLSEAIRFKTVSHYDRSLTDWEAFTAFHAWLEKTYPHAHACMSRDMINTYTLHYRWEGRRSEIDPILLTAHQDVVPVGDLDHWEHDPFAGVIEEGYLWGRGTLDVKNQIITIFEAIEQLAAEGYTPERSIHLCFGHDEEVGGSEGAGSAVEYFKQQGIHFSMVLDEGGAVTEHMLEGINRPIATIGIGEKGYMDLVLKSSSAGGHASMPLQQTALSTLARAIVDVQSSPMPARLTPAPLQMFKTLGPYMSVSSRIVIANLWLLKPLFLKIMGRNPAGNAMIRTTMAATMAHGSDAANVLPTEAEGIINVRLLHGDSPEDVISYVQQVLHGQGIIIERRRAEGPSAISTTDSPEFERLTKTIADIFPAAVITPYLMVGGSDARKYEPIADHIYRFCPYQLEATELGRMHSYNERISVQNIYAGVRFFTSLIRAFDPQQI
ncbi:MAG: M20 family peptidase [Spirochaetia bacterium]|nr:M20 family peptidase [Spirochaetia bacterium]